MPESKVGISPDQIRPKKPNRHLALNPEAAGRIRANLTDISQKGPEGAPQNPVLVAAERIYTHLTSLEEQVAKTEAIAKGIKQRAKEAEQRAKDLKQIAYTDHLTGVFNRRYLEETINIFNSDRDHNNLGVVFIDINFLKKTNDTNGHAAGDLLIKLTANILKEVFRSGDILSYIGGENNNPANSSQPEDIELPQQDKEDPAEEPKGNYVISRLDGDEFVVLCHNTTENPNFKVVFEKTITDRLNNAISNYNQNIDKYKDKIKYPLLSIAIGTAVYNKDIDQKSVSQTIARAEAVMYEQKKAIHANRE
jgi:GGDEF domain-containing protein